MPTYLYTHDMDDITKIVRSERSMCDWNEALLVLVGISFFFPFLIFFS
jgi:hypothetical protein